MTPEKFRQWIVILFALSILTVWLSMGLRICKWREHPAWRAEGQGAAMTQRMPARTMLPAMPRPAMTPRKSVAPAPAKAEQQKPVIPAKTQEPAK
jgi:hypothetical protein